MFRSGSDLHDQHNTSKQLPSVVLCGKHDFSFLLQPLCNPMHEFTEEPELLSNRTAFFLHKSNLLLTLLSSATLNVSKALPSAGHRTTSSQKKTKKIVTEIMCKEKWKKKVPKWKLERFFFVHNKSPQLQQCPWSLGSIYNCCYSFLIVRRCTQLKVMAAMSSTKLKWLVPTILCSLLLCYTYELS